MSSKDVIVALGNDLSLKRGFTGYVDSSIVLEYSALAGDSTIMGKGSHDSVVPEFLLLGGFLNSLVYVISGGHDECSEVLGLKDNGVVVILFALVVVITSGE